MSWNPERYLAFGDHRTRPAVDLLARVALTAPARVADLGCGPGNLSAAGWAVSIIGTPFALAFKTVVCAASLVVAAPVADFLALGVDPYGEGYDALGDGLAQNCGPPYVVSPYAAS